MVLCFTSAIEHIASLKLEKHSLCSCNVKHSLCQCYRKAFHFAHDKGKHITLLVQLGRLASLVSWEHFMNILLWQKFSSLKTIAALRFTQMRALLHLFCEYLESLVPMGEHFAFLVPHKGNILKVKTYVKNTNETQIGIFNTCYDITFTHLVYS